MLVYTIKELCRTCYTCVRECPAKAIRIVGGRAGAESYIDRNKPDMAILDLIMESAFTVRLPKKLINIPG